MASEMEILKQAIAQGVSFSDLLKQGQVQIARTESQRKEGLRNQPPGTTMVFPNSKGSFSTKGMKYPINIDKYNNQGDLVQSYKNIQPGVGSLPMGPDTGTVIETPVENETVAKTGGPIKYQQEGSLQKGLKPLTKEQLNYMNFWHGKGLGRIKNLKPIIAKELYENYNFPAGLDLSENVTTSRSKVFDDNAWETSKSIPYATEDYEMYYPKLKQGGSIKYQKEGDVKFSQAEQEEYWKNMKFSESGYPMAPANIKPPSISAETFPMPLPASGAITDMSLLDIVPASLAIKGAKGSIQAAKAFKLAKETARQKQLKDKIYGIGREKRSKEEKDYWSWAEPYFQEGPKGKRMDSYNLWLKYKEHLYEKGHKWKPGDRTLKDATRDYKKTIGIKQTGGPVKYQKEGFYLDPSVTGIGDKKSSGDIEPPSGQRYWTDWSQYFQHANPWEKDISQSKEFILNQIKNPAFRNRYRENYKLVTGTYPTDQELDARLNAQINYVDMGPDYALAWPYSSTLPDASIMGMGTKKEHLQYTGPIVLPFSSNIGKEHGRVPESNYLATNPFFSNIGAQWHKQTPFGNIDPKLQSTGNILQSNFASELADLEGINSWDIKSMDASKVESLAKKHNFKMPQHYQYPWMVGFKTDQYGDHTLRDFDRTMAHEVGHSMNSPQSPLWRTKNLWTDTDNPNLYQTHKNRPRNLSLQSYDFQSELTLDKESKEYNPATGEYEWGTENPYQDFIMRDLFNVKGKPSESGWRSHSQSMSEMSSAKQEVLWGLRKKNIYDVTTEGTFNPEHLDAMLEQDFNPRGHEPNLHFESMGYDDLSNTYNTLSKTQQNITGHQENINITQQNLEDFNDLSEEDKISYLMDEDISNQYSGTMNDFVTEFNQGKKEKHHLNFQTASEILQGKKQKGKKYETAKNFMSQYQSTFTKTLEDELNDFDLQLQEAEEKETELNKKYEKLRPEVEDKFDIYFNKLVQKESTEEPSQAHAQTGGVIPRIEEGSKYQTDLDSLHNKFEKEGWRKWWTNSLLDSEGKKRGWGRISEDNYITKVWEKFKESPYFNSWQNSPETQEKYRGDWRKFELDAIKWNKDQKEVLETPTYFSSFIKKLPREEEPVPYDYSQNVFSDTFYSGNESRDTDSETAIILDKYTYNTPQEYVDHMRKVGRPINIHAIGNKATKEELGLIEKDGQWWAGDEGYNPNFGKEGYIPTPQKWTGDPNENPSKRKTGGAVKYQKEGIINEGKGTIKPSNVASAIEKRDYWLYKNANKNFVKRILEPELNKGREVYDDRGNPMSHFMISMDNFVIPMVIDLGEGKFHQFKDPNKAYQYAMETGEYIQTDTTEEADWLAKNYKTEKFKESYNYPKQKKFGGLMFPKNVHEGAEQLMGFNKEAIKYQDKGMLDLKGYFKGEQGIFPDLWGQSTKEMLGFSSPKIEKGEGDLKLSIDPFKKWLESLPEELQHSEDDFYDLRGAYNANLNPEDGILASRDPESGLFLKYEGHETFEEDLQREEELGYSAFIDNRTGSATKGRIFTFREGDSLAEEFNIFNPGKNEGFVPYITMNDENFRNYIISNEVIGEFKEGKSNKSIGYDGTIFKPYYVRTNKAGGGTQAEKGRTIGVGHKLTPTEGQTGIINIILKNGETKKLNFTKGLNYNETQMLLESDLLKSEKHLDQLMTNRNADGEKDWYFNLTSREKYFMLDVHYNTGQAHKWTNLEKAMKNKDYKLLQDPQSWRRSFGSSPFRQEETWIPGWGNTNMHQRNINSWNTFILPLLGNPIYNENNRKLKHGGIVKFRL